MADSSDEIYVDPGLPSSVVAVQKPMGVTVGPVHVHGVVATTFGGKVRADHVRRLASWTLTGVDANIDKAADGPVSVHRRPYTCWEPLLVTAVGRRHVHHVLVVDYVCLGVGKRIWATDQHHHPSTWRVADPVVNR
jgi:hypothetical protein